MKALDRDIDQLLKTGDDDFSFAILDCQDFVSVHINREVILSGSDPCDRIPPARL